jgi:hypothetical protein
MTPSPSTTPTLSFPPPRSPSDLYQFGYASSVAAPHTVHLVHDHQSLLGAPVSAHALAQHHISYLVEEEERRRGGQGRERGVKMVVC